MYEVRSWTQIEVRWMSHHGDNAAAGTDVLAGRLKTLHVHVLIHVQHSGPGTWDVKLGTWDVGPGTWDLFTNLFTLVS